MAKKIVSQSLRIKVAERAKRRCEYCQSPESLSVGSFHVDHVVPLARSGATRLSNLAYCCPGCNSSKWSKVRARDPKTNRLVALFNPRRQAWADHFQWSNDENYLVGQTPCGRATVEALEMNRSRLIQLRQLWKKWGHHPPPQTDR